MSVSVGSEALLLAELKLIVHEIKWNAIDLKCGDRLTSHDVNVFSRIEVSSQTMLYRVKQHIEKAFQGRSDPRYVF